MTVRTTALVWWLAQMQLADIEGFTPFRWIRSIEEVPRWRT